MHHTADTHEPPEHTRYNPSGTPSEWSREQRVTRIRNMVCMLLCAVAGVIVCVCFAMPFVSFSMLARSRAEGILRAIERSPRLDVTIRAKPVTVYSRFSRAAVKEAVDVYGFVEAHAQLTPRVSDHTGRLRFDGVVQLRSLDGQVMHYVLINHRGYRVVSSSNASYPSNQTECLQQSDLPPLHDLEFSFQHAQKARNPVSVGLDCPTESSALAIVLARVTFMMCVDEVSPFRKAVHQEVREEVMPVEELYVVNAQLSIWIKWKVQEARQMAAPLTHGFQVERCPYLEAPLATPPWHPPRVLTQLYDSSRLPEQYLND